jgi:hypothetical protein
MRRRVEAEERKAAAEERKARAQEEQARNTTYDRWDRWYNYNNK